jgi:hypothetical protein
MHKMISEQSGQGKYGLAGMQVGIKNCYTTIRLAVRKTSCRAVADREIWHKHVTGIMGYVAVCCKSRP